MRVSITKIGNSKGIIIPAQLLKHCGFGQEVSLEVEEDKLVISSLHHPREGWKEAFVQAGAGDEEHLMGDLENDFDKDEWTW